MDILDLVLGNPSYLVSFWNHHEEEIPDKTDTRYVLTTLLAKYKKELIEILNHVLGLHLKAENVVIGSGTTQLYHGFMKVLSLKGLKTAFFLKPNLFTLASILSLNGFTYSDQPDVDVEIIVTPNNPTGEKNFPMKNSKYQLYDFAYNWPEYLQGKPPANIDPNTNFLLSLSKVFGLAGYRIGIGNFPGLAFEIEKYVADTSLGVNSAGLDFIFRNKSVLEKCITTGTEIMNKRWKTILKLNDPLLMNNSGGYLWYRRPASVFAKYGIISLPGSLAFSTDADSRIDMMCSQKEFKILLSRLKKIIHDQV